jgi:8-oxo-dGTP diphosphatase
MLVPCVGAIIHDPSQRLLLIRRSHAPHAGAWSLPGGRVEPGESDAGALAREVFEETGLTVAVGALVGWVDRPGPPPSVFRIRDYACMVTGGALRPGDDASDARWWSAGQAAALPLTPGLAQTLQAWGVRWAP